MIIPQNLINEIKNMIKIIFNKKINKIVKNYTNNIIDNIIPTAIIQSQLEYEKDMANLYIEVLEEAIPLIDKAFMNSKYRKDNFYISKQNIIRDRELYMGSLLYERNYYCDKKKKNGFYFIDCLFEFEKYNKYDSIIHGLLIQESVNSNVNQAVCNSIYSCSIKNYFNKPKITKQTVYNWIRNFKIPNIEYKPISTNGTLYVMADEKWIHKQFRKELKNKIKIGLSKYTQEEIDEFKKQLKNKQYIMSKCFVIFTSAVTKNNRTELIGRHIFVTSSKSPYKDLMDEICKIYDFETINTINLLSDAGSWILAGKDELKLYSHNKIVVNTCEFHVKQKLNRMIRDKELNALMALDIYEYKDKKDFKKFVDIILKKRPHRKDKINEYANYILKHWNSIINMVDCDYKSSMESHISHYVAAHFGSRPKGYSEKNIEQYLKLETLKNNGFNIFDLYLSSINNENLIYSKEKLDFYLFEKSSSNIPTCSSKNPTSIAIHNLANS